MDDGEREQYLALLPRKFRGEYIILKSDDTCHLCGTAFSLLSFDDQKKRSQCRRCGESICRMCSQTELPICQETIDKVERVCDKCACDIQNLHHKAHYRQQISLHRDRLDEQKHKKEEIERKIKYADKYRLEKFNKFQFLSSQVDGLYRDFDLEAAPNRDIQIPNLLLENLRLQK